MDVNDSTPSFFAYLHFATDLAIFTIWKFSDITYRVPKNKHETQELIR